MREAKMHFQQIDSISESDRVVPFNFQQLLRNSLDDQLRRSDRQFSTHKQEFVRNPLLQGTRHRPVLK
jgi:hypothetical protein